MRAKKRKFGRQKRTMKVTIVQRTMKVTIVQRLEGYLVAEPILRLMSHSDFYEMLFLVTFLRAFGYLLSSF